MKWQRCVSVMAALVLALGTAAEAEVITHGGTSINMDFVSVGNAGNAADDTGYGAVGYNYRIGKYEVTADQWAAVRAADPNVGNAGFWSGSQPTGGTSWYEAAIGSSRGLRGGDWGSTSGNLRASASNPYGTPTNEGSGWGFRVASVPEPASIWLMLGGGLAGMYWWKRRK